MSVSQIGGAGGDTVTDCITVHVSERGWLYILLVGLTASVNEIGCIVSAIGCICQRSWPYLSAGSAVFVSRVGCICQRGWLYLSAELAVCISGVGCMCQRV